MASEQTPCRCRVDARPTDPVRSSRPARQPAAPGPLVVEAMFAGTARHVLGLVAATLECGHEVRSRALALPHGEALQPRRLDAREIQSTPGSLPVRNRQILSCTTNGADCAPEPNILATDKPWNRSTEISGCRPCSLPPNLCQIGNGAHGDARIGARAGVSHGDVI
jgi:hypothetical protein